MLYQAGLVLEGGGMKGVYTSGVLDFFMDKGISFAKCYGVSAGACTLCSYLSGREEPVDHGGSFQCGNVLSHDSGCLKPVRL